MAPALALLFLSFVLFFLMNGYGSNARDMNVVLRDEKRVDLNGASPVSKDKPYIAGYRTTPDSTQTYKASYTFMKHSHLSHSHHRKVNKPYITGYKTSTHEVNGPNISGRRTPATHKANQPYIFPGYTKTSNHDSNEPYIAGYRTTAAHEAKQPYTAGYGTSTPDSSEPYIAAYATAAQEANQPYIAGYGTSTHDSNEPYIAGYKTTAAHEAKQPYTAGYRTGTLDSSKPCIAAYTTAAQEASQPYVAGYRTSTHDSNEPYIAGYRTTAAHEANQPYIAGYGTRTHDSSEPYISGYRTTLAHGDPKESDQDSTKPYTTQNGLRPKKDSKESTQDSSEPYITQYGRIGPKTDPKESANADHIEAFKTGFFTLDDLYVENIMTLQFPVEEFSHFLPRKEADSIPFSMSQLTSVLQLFSISEDSPMVKSMKGTLEQCEADPITGETKICVTSLESMLEFVSTIIGSEANYNILTTSYPTTSSATLQHYTILEVSKDINAPKWVACHPLPYPYAVYYCHFIGTGSKLFKVLLEGENGNKMEALGLCHLDTTDWSPDHILFRQLGIKPGEAPVCHFFPVKHLLWVPLPSKATM